MVAAIPSSLLEICMKYEKPTGIEHKNVLIHCALVPSVWYFFRLAKFTFPFVKLFCTLLRIHIIAYLYTYIVQKKNLLVRIVPRTYGKIIPCTNRIMLFRIKNARNIEQVYLQSCHYEFTAIFHLSLPVMWPTCSRFTCYNGKKITLHELWRLNATTQCTQDMETYLWSQIWLDKDRWDVVLNYRIRRKIYW